MPRSQSRVAALVLVPVLGIVVGLGIRNLVSTPAAKLPVLGVVPEFTLIGQRGQPVSAADLRGKVWVADFIFTRCEGMCPVLSSAMASLNRELGGDPGVQLVSFSVDPEHDTPSELASYAERYTDDVDRWWFLTGERRRIYDLVGKGFKLSVAASDPETVHPGELVTHSDRLVVVDRRLRIRAYHHGTEPDVQAAVLRDVRALAAEGR